MAAESRIFRLLHGAPVLGGVPVHYALGLLFVVLAGGSGGMLVSGTVGLVVAASGVGLWGFLSVLHRQDRAVMTLFLLRLRYRFPRVVSSYRPSGRRVRLDPGKEVR